MVISEDGKQLIESGLESIWPRFSLQETSSARGNTARKSTRQQALCTTEAMMKVYDHSLAVVKPSDMP